MARVDGSMRAFLFSQSNLSKVNNVSQNDEGESTDDATSQVEAIAHRLKHQILKDLEKLETMSEPDEISGEHRLKCLTGIFKLLQTVEEMIKRSRDERERKQDRGVDILEFRKQLEKQIAKLVDKKAEGIVS